MLRRVALVRTDVSEERSAYIIMVTRIISTLMMEALQSSETSVLTGATRVTSQNTAFFIVTAVKTSNLTCYVTFYVSAGVIM
jgi:hypothetical protein